MNSDFQIIRKNNKVGLQTHLRLINQPDNKNINQLVGLHKR